MIRSLRQLLNKSTVLLELNVTGLTINKSLGESLSKGIASNHSLTTLRLSYCQFANAQGYFDSD